MAIALNAIVPIENVASPLLEGLASNFESVDLLCDLLGQAPDQLLTVSHENSRLNVNFCQLVEEH